MTKSVFNKGNMLPYVNEEYDRVVSSEQTTPLLMTSPKSNGLALTAIILTGVGFLGAILIVPTVISIGFSIAALVVAAKRGTSKVLSLVALSLSILFFISGSVVAGLLLSAYEPEREVQYPANYVLDFTSGIAYKYVPATQIPCDAAGACTVTVELIATEDVCAVGGSFEQSVFSLSTQAVMEPVTVDIPPVDVGETATITIPFISLPNDVLMVNTTPYISCL